MSNITSGLNELPASSREWEALAQRVLDKREMPGGYTQTAMQLAHFVARACGQMEYVEVIDQLSMMRERCAELFKQRSLLSSAIEKIAGSDPDTRDGTVAEAVVLARGLQ